MSGDARAEAARVVKERMDTLGLSATKFCKLAGISTNTLSKITKQTGNVDRSTWVAVAAVLDLPWDYLANIVYGGHAVISPQEKHLSELAEQSAGISALKEAVSGLVDIVHAIDRKLDVAIAAKQSPGDARSHAQHDSGPGSA